LFLGGSHDFAILLGKEHQLAPMQEMIGMLRRHRKQPLNWFAAKGELSSDSVEDPAAAPKA